MFAYLKSQICKHALSMDHIKLQISSRENRSSGELRAPYFPGETGKRVRKGQLFILNGLKKVRPGPHWLMLGVTVILLGLVATLVDLKPRVDGNFFFSSTDPQFQESKKIDGRFPSGSQLIISVSSSDISSERYLERLQQLTRKIKSIQSVTGVRSLTDGPKNFADAEASPFWRRLLIAENHQSSNIIAFTESKDPEQLIRRLEGITQEFDKKDFRIRIAGAPYVVEMIRRSLEHDFRYFSLTAVVLFGLTMWVVFRSARLCIGMFATCTSAVLLTLLVQSLFGRKIGILTVNLGTIVFVVALSHLVYMTFNWQTLAGRLAHPAQPGKKSRDLGREAHRMTFPASFWSMVCASLGFGSLLLVPAKPLRELGFGGVLGTVIAMVCAYGMYPSFLSWAVPKRTPVTEKGPGRRFWSRRFVPLSACVVLVSFVLGFGLRRLNTDPSLLDYFKPHQELREGLEYVDRNGGSNPLTLVIAARDGSKLNTSHAYHEMWSLQNALEDHKGVGTVVSLPVLIAEGDRRPLAFLLSKEHMLRIMEEPKHERVARSFVTPDRMQAAFYIRMVEHGRVKPRLEVLNDLRSIVRRRGFKPALVGGIYRLQGELAQLVASSLVTGLFWLMVLFAIIALIVARSIRVAAAMILSLGLVPLCMLGGIGILHVPVDIISAPATNICIGMAIDSMVHLVFGVRRAQRDGKKGWNAWIAGREEQWRGIVYSDVIIAAGFAIFVLSDFPPTQRFGLVVVFGTIIDILANLFVLPLLGGASLEKKPALREELAA
jgi:predicted RND superfamily exporter protein